MSSPPLTPPALREAPPAAGVRTAPLSTRRRLTGRMRDTGHRTFAALDTRNYRLFLGGQAVSLVGTWMQSVAQSWLVLQITDSGAWLGIVVALQMLPVLLGAPYGGLIADRMDKRRLLTVTQAGKGLTSLVIGVLAVTGTVQLWMICVLALLFGACNAVDNPTRQTFINEIVGPERLRNAVTLNSVIVNVGRMLGPAVAGVLIVTVGVGPCFLIDAASYIAVITALLRMDRAALHPSKPAPRAPGQLREGVRYVRSQPVLLVPLLMMAVIGCLAYEFQTSLPLLAKQSFGGGADTYGFMTAAMGAGAVVGGLWTAGRSVSGVRALASSATVFGAALTVAAAAPTLLTCLAALVVVGGASISLMSTGTSTLQLHAAGHMRGRVMALWSVAFLGSTPIGGPIIGLIGEHIGARWAVGVGGVAALLCAAVALLGDRYLRRSR